MKKRDFKVRKCMSFSPQMADRLENISFKKGITQSQLLEKALRMYLKMEMEMALADEGVAKDLAEAVFYERDA